MFLCFCVVVVFFYFFKQSEIIWKRDDLQFATVRLCLLRPKKKEEENMILIKSNINTKKVRFELIFLLQGESIILFCCCY